MEGKDTVGGVVGKNKGEVRECSASGEIHGELSVGGIAGENNGFLAECRNEADVNTEYEEKKQELSDIDTDAAAILGKYRISKENTERSNLTYTDIGGVEGVDREAHGFALAGIGKKVRGVVEVQESRHVLRTKEMTQVMKAMEHLLKQYPENKQQAERARRRQGG